MGIYNGNAKRIIFTGAMDNKNGNITVYDADNTRTGGIPNY